MFYVAILVARSFQIVRPARFVPALLWFALGGELTSPMAAQGLFAPPESAAPSNEILLISTRALGTSCNADRLDKQLWCQRLQVGDDGQPAWTKADWRRALQPSPIGRTIIYVHGNRVRRGEDLSRGMLVYRSLVSRSHSSEPIRFIIWSWPSSTIPGPIKDLHVKAARTGPAGW
ncbi:MAG: hypothetical protein MI725_11310, partial [Pirellulales bacterium]|nr:hypothetical protein [Pirellulales bacterium]